MTALAPWQQRVLDGAIASLAGDRLGHALLLTGQPRMGKGEVARRLAQRMLCRTPGADGLACGACRGCHLFAVGTHPDLRHVTFLPTDKGDKLRSELLVEQMRQLSDWFALTPQMGGAQVALIEPANAMNVAASNALLKTLEEPARNRYLLLVSDRPAGISATIRSRCQKLEFRPPARAEAEAWLRAQGHAAADATAALDAARGHPGLAADWLADGGLALRRGVEKDMNALAAGREAPVDLAKRWLGDDHAALRLRFAAELALDGSARRLGVAVPSGLTLPADFQKLSAWFDGANRLREQLPLPALRHDLALAGLLLEWRSLFNDPGASGARR